MKPVILSLIFLITLTTTAQTLREYAEVNRPEKNVHFSSVIDANASGFYTWAVSGKGKKADLFLEKYDLSGNLIFSSATQNVVSTLAWGTNFYLFHSAYDQDAQKKTLSCERVADNGTIESPAILSELAAQKGQESKSNFYIVNSPDRSKVLIVSQMQPVGQEESTLFEWYDAVGMKRLWSQKLSPQQKFGQVQTSAFKVDNDGNVLLNVVYGTSAKEIAAFNTTVSLGIVKSKSHDITLFSYALDAGKTAASRRIRISNDGIAFIAGLFKDPQVVDGKKIYAGNAGVYSVKVDLKTGAVSKPLMNYFSKEVEQKITYKCSGGDFPAAKNIDPVQIIEFEKSFYVVYEFTFQNVNGSIVSRFSKELILVRYNPEGAYSWMKVLPRSAGYKDYDNVGMEESSVINYNFIKSENQLNFVYLEHPKNTKRFTVDDFSEPDMEDVNSAKESNAVCISVNESGRLSKTVFEPADDFRIILQFQDVVLNKKGLLVFMKKGNREKFGTIDFN